MEDGRDPAFWMTCPYTKKQCYNDDNHCYCCPSSPDGQVYLREERERQAMATDRITENMFHIIDNNDDADKQFAMTVTISGKKVTYVLDSDTGAIISCDDTKRNEMIQTLKP